MTAIARNKIASQARIFGSASVAIAWLSDVDNIKGLQSAARWMSLSLLEHPPERPHDFDSLDDVQ